jgi:pyruvate/2-oxoglutarate dehydrogenase complex dihydrolipoamide dehydrogenase (E3) component
MRLLVLGGGPAGLNAALQARELNADVTLIERNRIGGTSLNEGPAPVRTLARAARLLRDTQSWSTFFWTSRAKAPFGLLRHTG